ncbi:MAG: CFI-box-CTERM domain-containing protein [Bdellovibrio sp.]
MSEISCPRCGSNATELHKVDEAVMAKIQESGKEASIPPQVCSNCFAEMTGSIARGSILLAHEKAKEQKKMQLWKSRMTLIKNARKFMGQKAYSEAAVQYEKYIRVLEMVFDAKAGELEPEPFRESARTQELTVVASAYWDLLRIYDTNDQWSDRRSLAVNKLAQFVRYTPIYQEIMRKAEVFQKTARHPNVIKEFIKLASEKKRRCFIASSAFENAQSPEVLRLQGFRDEFLISKAWGRFFVRCYDRFSPPLALILDRTPWMRRWVRGSLRVLLRFLPKSRK